MITNLYCHNCTNRVGVEAEPCNVRLCPECGSENITLHVQEMEYEDMISKIVAQVVAEFDYNKATEVIDELGLYLRAIAFYRQHGALLDLMVHLEQTERGLNQ
jgi:hypothetical protein